MAGFKEIYISSRAVWRALRARPATEMHGAATNAPFPLQENPARYKSARYKITRWKVMYWFRESVVFTYKVYWHQFLQHWTHTKNENVSRSCLDFRMRARNKVPKSSQKFPNSAPTQYITLLCHFIAIWFLLRFYFLLSLSNLLSCLVSYKGNVIWLPNMYCW